MALYSYCRASTDRQDESPDTQKGITLKWAYHRGLGEPEAFFVDVDISGKVPFRQRAAGAALMSRLRRGDTVVVARMDRAFRSMADFCVTVELWERMGVRLCLCDYELDMATPIGRMMAHILANFAQFERELISQRTKEGLAARKAKGRAHSRYAGYGKKLVKRWDPELQRYVKFAESDPKERAIMKQIVGWRCQSPPLSWDKIRQKLCYELRVRTREGKEWDINRVRRAYRAELKLQYQEVKRC